MSDDPERLCTAAVDGHLEEVMGLLKVPYLSTESRHNNSTPICYAAYGGRLDVVEFLANNGACLNAKGAGGVTALFLALEMSHLHVAAFLHARGCDLFHKNDDGEDALQRSAWGDDQGVSVWLIERGLDPDAEDNEGRSAISHYGRFLELDEDKTPLTTQEKKERVEVLAAARRKFLELQRREECWLRRKDFLVFLVGHGLRPTTAQKLEKELQRLSVDPDGTASLPPEDRSTPEANRQYLYRAVLGNESLSRRIVMKM